MPSLVQASELLGIFILILRGLWQGIFFDSKTYFAYWNTLSSCINTRQEEKHIDTSAVSQGIYFDLVSIYTHWCLCKFKIWMNGNMKSQETLLSISVLALKIKNQTKPSVNPLRSSFMSITILFFILLPPGISVRILKHSIQFEGSEVFICPHHWSLSSQEVLKKKINITKHKH